MRIFSAYAAVLAATLAVSPALAETYRDAAPVMTKVASSPAVNSSAYGFSGAGLGVSLRNDRDGDAAPASTVVNPGSGAASGSFGISRDVDAHGHFTSPRFE